MKLSYHRNNARHNIITDNEYCGIQRIEYRRRDLRVSKAEIQTESKRGFRREEKRNSPSISRRCIMMASSTSLGM